MPSFVLVVLSVRLLAEHLSDNLRISCLWAASSTFETWPTNVVSSVHLMMVMRVEREQKWAQHVPLRVEEMGNEVVQVSEGKPRSVSLLKRMMVLKAEL